MCVRVPVCVCVCVCVCVIVEGSGSWGCRMPGKYVFMASLC